MGAGFTEASAGAADRAAGSGSMGGGPVGPVAVSIVGSTGSIGRQAVEVIEANRDRFRVVALAGRSSWKLLAEQAARLDPEMVAVVESDAAAELRGCLPGGVKVTSGVGALCEAAAIGETVLNAIVGFAGLEVSVAALSEGRRLALANKESLVAGGDVVRKALAAGGEIVPVDSEHCAIHQCLRSATGAGEVERLVITTSGGPFRGKAHSELSRVSVDEALRHPTWRMGPKITIDSSTLMNKGLEVIEAHELFGVDYDRIEVILHPQSVVHSMVELVDGASMAQLSMPDMRLPIGYALGFPSRLPVPFGAIDWSVMERLDFGVVDRETFRCLAVAEAAGRAGGLVPAWMNAANEVAVEAFLQERVGWLDIAAIVEETVDRCEGGVAQEVEEVVEADRRAREVAAEIARAYEAPSRGGRWR